MITMKYVFAPTVTWLGTSLLSDGRRVKMVLNFTPGRLRMQLATMVVFSVFISILSMSTIY